MLSSKPEIRQKHSLQQVVRLDIKWTSFRHDKKHHCGKVKLCGWNLARRTQKHNHRRRKAHTQPQVQLLNCVILPPCHSLWLICNNWPSSSPPTQMDSHIDYTQSKKRKRKRKSSCPTQNTAPPSLLPHITHSVIPVMYLCTPPSEEYAIDLPSVCMFLCTSVCASVCVCLRGPDSPEPLFLHAGAAPIGFVRGSHIWAVLEIHQPWQVYCSTTLHSPWPTTHTEISLSIRKTFVSGWRWIWKDCSRLKRGQTKIAGWKEPRVRLNKNKHFSATQFGVTHFCVTFS